MALYILLHFASLGKSVVIAIEMSEVRHFKHLLSSALSTSFLQSLFSTFVANA